jgi:hypothetical protein
MVKRKQLMRKTIEEEQQAFQTKIGVGLVALVLVIVGSAYFVLQEDLQKCPACDQHYVVIDNSEALTEKALESIRAPSLTLDASLLKCSGGSNGEGRYPAGLMGSIWNQSNIGDQINLYALRDDTLEAELLISKVREINPDIEPVPIDRNETRLRFDQDTAYCEINAQLEALHDQNDLPQSKVFETMYDIAIKIRNHEESYGSSFSYTVTLYSDLLQNSESYSFYSDPLQYSDWIKTQRSSVSLPVFLPRVKINVRWLPRATSPVPEIFLRDFWTDYLDNSRAKFTVLKG